MDTTQALQHITELHKEQMKGLRHIAKQQAKIIRLLEARQTGPLSAFLSRIWNAFSRRLATNIGQWLAGLPLWLLALKGLGLDRLLADWFGFSI
jgi:hypothetical protein